MSHGHYLKGSSWKKTWYNRGQHAEDCRKLTSSEGKDLLVCEYRDNLMDAGIDPKNHYGLPQFFFGLDNSLGACMKRDGAVSNSELESVSFVPVAGSLAIRILVDAKLGKAAIPDDVLGHCEDLTIATEPLHFEFLFDGQKIAEAPNNPPVYAPAMPYQLRAR